MTDREYLAHIEAAILEIKAHTAGMTQEAYEADSKTQRAVERNLQIIGDAAHKLSKAFRQAHPDVPWEDVYAARNVVVHHYFGVNQRILWDIVQSDLEPLLKKVQGPLAQDDPSER
jgi:uncharacterized protein with HEPN domain